MSASREDRIGIVVDHDALLTPERDDRYGRAQDQTDGGLDGCRPVRNGAERRLRPVESFNDLGELATPDEKRVQSAPLRTSRPSFVSEITVHVGNSAPSPGQHNARPPPKVSLMATGLVLVQARVIERPDEASPCLVPPPALGSACCPAGGSTCSTPRRSTSRSRTSRTGLPASRAGTGRPPARISSRSRSTRCWSRRSRGGAAAARPPRAARVLLHDAPEYVIGDMISPFKAVIGDAYKAVEQRLLAAIHLRFGLPAELPAELTRLIKARRPHRGLSRGDAARGLRGDRGDAFLRPAARRCRRASNGII